MRFASLLLVTFVLGCRPEPSRGAPIDPSRLTDGEFTGSAAHINKATVTITVDRQRVTKLTVDTFDASPVGQAARDEIPRRIVEQQSTLVDAVSGATEASNVLMNAASAAVEKSYAKKAAR